MERKKKNTSLLFLLFHLIKICRSEDCPKQQNKNLTCYNDFNQNITCEWNSWSDSAHTDNVCTLHAERISRVPYSSSCDLKPFSASRPEMKTCSLIFKYTYIFATYHNLSMTVTCTGVNQSINISYKPACHVKVNPPPKPNVNFTTVSWFTQTEKHIKINSFRSELQWKHKDKSWSDPSVQKKNNVCEMECNSELDPDLLIQGETYEARVRVKSLMDVYNGIWSDWSPTESWVSSVGKIKPPSETTMNILNMSLAGLAVFGLLLAVISFRMHKANWVYVIKKISNPPTPNPAKATYFQNWFSPNFTKESFQSYMKPVEINPVELTSNIDAVTFCEPVVKVMPGNTSYESSGSSFSNPSYSELCSHSADSSLSFEGLQPCAADAPYGPVRGQAEGRNKDQGGGVAAETDKIMRLLLNASKDNESVKVLLDYEKVEKLQAERLRLHSIDSGMCSYEEVSQESMEVDSINMTDGHKVGTLTIQEKKGRDGMIVDVPQFFGNNGGILGKNSIQVCFDYKQIPKLQDENPELPKLDSGVSSRDEKPESLKENMGDKNTHFQFPPHPSSVLKCSLLSSSPFILSDSSLTPLVPPLSSTNIFEKIPLMSGSMLVAPCADDYMSVRQEQN